MGWKNLPSWLKTIWIIYLIFILYHIFSFFFITYINYSSFGVFSFKKEQFLAPLLLTFVIIAISIIEDKRTPELIKNSFAWMFYLIPLNFFIMVSDFGEFLRDDVCRKIFEHCSFFTDYIPLPRVLGWILIFFFGLLEGIIVGLIIRNIKSKKQQPIQTQPQVQTK